MSRLLSDEQPLAPGARCDTARPFGWTPEILNGFYAQSFNGKYGRWGHVFGDRFWSRSLQEEDLERTCLYVMANPVRAGLCARMADWPWSACRYELD